VTDGNQPPSSNSTIDTQLEELQKQIALVQAQNTLLQAQQQQATTQLTARLEQEQSIAAQQKELLETLFPQGTTTPLEGTITTTGSWGFASEIVAYQVMGKIQADFVAQLDEEEMKTAKVLIVDKLEYALEDIPLAEVNEHSELFENLIDDQAKRNEEVKDQYKNLVGPADEPVAAALDPVSLALLGTVAVPSLIGRLADVAGYFRTNYTVTGQEFSLRTEGVAAAVAGKLIQKGATVHVSNFYATGDESALLKRFIERQKAALKLKSSRDELAFQYAKPLNDRIELLNQRTRELEAARIRLDSATQQPQIDEIEKDLAQLGQQKQVIQAPANAINAAIQASDVILTAFDTFAKDITSSTDGQQPPKIVRAMLREKVPAEITHLLWVGSLYSGGNAITKQSRWFSGNTSYMGGTAVAFVLATRDGTVVAADTLKGIGALDYKFSKGREGKVRYIGV
jgi:hypothetical protein